ncbi:MAG TPA: M15 family metallopeptidase [Mycobacterium sp.]|nr:M15 family metallopeptidase [Mycobacterium sp.]
MTLLNRVVALMALGSVAVGCAGPPDAAPAGIPSSGPASQPTPATVAPVSAAELGASWHKGCPIGADRLRRIGVDYLGFDAQPHRGELIVNVELVQQVIGIFEQLYRIGFPIEKMRTVEHYPGARDELSMADDNTSAFNCREIPGSGHWSKHAYGRAIDVNPRLNPSIGGAAGLQPANAQVYTDRHRIDPGLLHADDPAVRTFTDRGWHWGGYWRSPVDYQHFERR